MHRLKGFQENIFSIDSLNRTVDRMIHEKQMTLKQNESIRKKINSGGKDVKYILKNLSAHVFIGVIFAFDVIPLPLGTISRVCWVAGNRFFTTFMKIDKDKQQVHNFKVLFFSAIPWVGYFAYLIPLMKIDTSLTNLYANHISYHIKDKSFNSYLLESPKLTQKLFEFVIKR